MVETLEVGIDDGVGAISGDHTALPAAVADHLVPFEIVERAFGGRDDLDVEALEQGARAEILPLQQRRDGVVVAVGGRCGQRLVDAEQIGKHMIEPQPGRCAPKQIIVLGKTTPDRPAVCLDRRAVQRRHAEILKADALAEQHAENVVVRNDEQLRRIRKGSFSAYQRGSVWPCGLTRGRSLIPA